MSTQADTPQQYTDQLPPDRKEAISKLRKIISGRLPEGFSEEMSCGMIGYVVPKSVYPEGYHVNPKLPLPLMHIASQKNHVAVYHMGLYTDEKMRNWFLQEYSKFSRKKPDIGKSCIRFKKTADIPFELIGQLAEKINPETWVGIYRERLKR